MLVVRTIDSFCNKARIKSQTEYRTNTSVLNTISTTPIYKNRFQAFFIKCYVFALNVFSTDIYAAFYYDFAHKSTFGKHGFAGKKDYDDLCYYKSEITKITIITKIYLLIKCRL